MDVHWLWIDNQWISIDNQWISGNPFRHHTALRGFQPYKSRRFCGAHLCEFWDFHVFSFPPPPWIPIAFYVILGGTIDNQGSVWGQLGQPLIILEVVCRSLTFPEIPKSRNIYFLVFPVTVFDEIQWYRYGIDVHSFSNPWCIKKLCFL